MKNTLHDLGDAEHRVAFYSESTSNSQMEHIPRDAIFKMTNHGIHYDLWVCS